ncbi:MAG: hypothetical protein Q8O88_04220 [bacterium]|nr:hypothetical protein [bacterium]
MKSILVSEKVLNGDTKLFNDKINIALEQIEQEGGFIRDKKYNCKGVNKSEYSLWHSVLIFYEVIPTRKVLTEKTEK